jgi:hypothetical protein
MPKRRAPIDAPVKSSVTYPSSVFSLEKDEIYPYERFAYNVLSIGVGALHEKGLPERLNVDFSRVLPKSSPWTINASIRCERGNDNKAEAFHVETPELLPAIVYLFSAVVAPDFFEDWRFESLRADPELLGRKIHLFADAVNAGVRAYRDNQGMGHAIRASYDFLELGIGDLPGTAHYYDLLTKLMANHEIAHASVGQLQRQPGTKPIERIAFELLADMVGTYWFYRKMIVNTPDTDEYVVWSSCNSRCLLRCTKSGVFDALPKECIVPSRR